jgi:hypothetical protein
MTASTTRLSTLGGGYPHGSAEVPHGLRVNQPVYLAPGMRGPGWKRAHITPFTERSLGTSRVAKLIEAVAQEERTTSDFLTEVEAKGSEWWTLNAPPWRPSTATEPFKHPPPHRWLPIPAGSAVRIYQTTKNVGRRWAP